MVYMGPIQPLKIRPFYGEEEGDTQDEDDIVDNNNDSGMVMNQHCCRQCHLHPQCPLLPLHKKGHISRG